MITTGDPTCYFCGHPIPKERPTSLRRGVAWPLRYPAGRGPVCCLECADSLTAISRVADRVEAETRTGPWPDQRPGRTA